MCIGNPVKTKHLLDLPGANEKLTLWKADLDDEGSFDPAFDGSERVFHVTTPSLPHLDISTCRNDVISTWWNFYLVEVSWERRMTRGE